MATSSLRHDFLLACIFLLFTIGCERQQESARKETPSPQSSVAEAAAAAPLNEHIFLPERCTTPVEVELTPDQKTLKKAQEALDNGDIFETMKLSRGLIDSKEASVRASLVDIFRWVGKKAIPELVELVHDKNAEVASDAFAAWEFVLQEIPHDLVKAIAITNLVANLDDSVVIESALMHITNLELCYSLPALEGLVTGCRGKTCGQCAKRMFEHIAGEPWASPERTHTILKEQGMIK